MTRFDFVDEAIVDADPLRVFKAVIDEANRRTSWWMPHWEAKPRYGKEFGQIGTAIDITIHRVGTPKFSARVTEVIEGKLLKVEYFEGDYRGNGEWTFEPIDGKTRVRFRWNVVPHRLMFRVLAPFLKKGSTHSEVMQEGFRGMNRYLTTR
jgi:hypothetical protein